MAKIKLFLSRLFHRIIEYKLSCEVNRQISEGHIKIGDYTYGYHNIDIRQVRGNDVDIEIGKFCSLASGLTFITGGTHPTDWVSTYPLSERFLEKEEQYYTEGMPSSRGRIMIGNDVWIASDVTILSGVTIGDGAVIMAGAVVSRDVPPYAICGGVPARVVRYRFAESRIRALQMLRWWDWEREKIKKFIPLISSSDVDRFLQEAGVDVKTLID